MWIHYHSDFKGIAAKSIIQIHFLNLFLYVLPGVFCLSIEILVWFGISLYFDRKCKLQLNI